MANLSPRLPRRRTVFRVISIAFTIFIVAILLLFAYVYKESVGKFQLRKLSLPTRLFADFTPLRAGVPLSSDDLLEKLDRLGYRQAQSLNQAGDYVAGKKEIDVFTREFHHPTGAYPAQAIRVTFTTTGIEGVSALRGGANVETAALEP